MTRTGRLRCSVTKPRTSARFLTTLLDASAQRHEVFWVLPQGQGESGLAAIAGLARHEKVGTIEFPETEEPETSGPGAHTWRTPCTLKSYSVMKSIAALAGLISLLLLQILV